MKEIYGAGTVLMIDDARTAFIFPEGIYTPLDSIRTEDLPIPPGQGIYFLSQDRHGDVCWKLFRQCSRKDKYDDLREYLLQLAGLKKRLVVFSWD